MPIQNIALLVFARSVEEETKHKPFFAKRSLAKSLNIHTQNIATQSGLPVIYVDETKQTGFDFGSRFSNALKLGFNKGYDALITIGNDCPFLQVKHIIEAKKVLENGNTVLGPTYDGGFYLLGLSKENFNPTTFNIFSWGTDRIFEEIKNDFLKNQHHCYTLQKLRDIDFFSDLEKLNLQNICNVALRKIIQALTVTPIQNYAFIYISELKLLQPVIHNKGSPLLLTI